MVSRRRRPTHFAKKAGVDVAQLKTINTPKGEYLAANVTKKGRSAGEILCEALPKETLDNLLAQEHVLAKTERALRPPGALAGRDARR